eukprot:2862759-Pyramimonas_sp.AAC.1
MRTWLQTVVFQPCIRRSPPSTEVAIAQAVDPLKDEMQEFRARMSQLETSTGAGSSGKRHIALLNSLDISN